ncbi:MAG: ABC transporter substrate-binding protein [Solirubrobacterales bacterium]
MKKIVTLILSFIMLLSLTACSKLTSGTGGEKVLRLNEENLGYPSIYTVSSRGRGYLLSSFIFDTLTWKDEKGVIPLLAKEWTSSSDNKTWIFKLVENAKFTDGKPVTAEDVKFSYDYIKSHPYQWVSLNMVKEVKVVDKFTVEILLNDVYAPFITDIAGNVPIMPKHIWESVKEPTKFNTPESVIGSGPFKLNKYDKDAGTYVFEANKDYFYGKPVIDKLILSASSNPKEALEKGELDGAQSLKYGEAMQMKKEGKYKFIEGPGFWVCRIYFNFSIPEFNSKEIRQAFYYGINRNEIVEKALKNGAVPGNPGHIHPDSEWYSKDVKQYDYNLDTAKNLLDSAGAKDIDNDGIREYQGKKLKYEMLTTEDKLNESEMLKKYFSDMGIQLTVKSMDQKSVDSMLSTGQFQLALNGHGSFGGDPVLLARFTSNNTNTASTPSVTTQGGKTWSNVKFDELFSTQLKEIDKTKRYSEVAQLQSIIAEELPTLTLYYKKITFVYNDKVFDGWFFTKDGVSLAVPTIQNKLVYVKGTWKK